jgi:hypothetical protein
MRLVASQRCSDLAGQVVGENLSCCGGDTIECVSGDQSRIAFADAEVRGHVGVHIAHVQGGHGDIA